SLLLLIGTIAFFALEFSNTMEHLNVGEKVIASIFQSTNTRTAGFASIDIAAENDITKMLTILLMFIGGSPGSTAGGIKVTTFIVIFSTVLSSMRGKEDASFLGHRFDKKIVYKSLAVIGLSLMLIVIDLGVILFFNKPGGALDILLEATSAFGTVGLSASLTPKLNLLGKLMIMLTMFIGRVGPASLGIAILMKPRRGSESILPEGRMLVG
ncbi:MAG: potassium transporter TrkG, partial [Oscillospiraceae bacterium]